MSDPPTRDLDCAEAAEQLYALLDGELTPAWEAAVRQHLAECAPCFRLCEFERAFKNFLEVRAQTRGAPEPLKRRIFDELFSPTDDAG